MAAPTDIASLAAAVSVVWIGVGVALGLMNRRIAAARAVGPKDAGMAQGVAPSSASLAESRS